MGTKHTKILLSTLFLLITTSAFAQPSAVKNVQKAVFAFITYDKAGNKLDEGNGVFISNDGEAIAQCKPFIGCYRAEITDYSGKKYEVKRIIGANEVHNVVHLKTDAKTTPATILNAATPQQGTKLYCVGTKQNGAIKQGAVRSVETFLDKYSYYIIKMTEQEDLGGCPFVTEQGQVVGLLEISANTADAYSTDIRYGKSLIPQVLSASDPTLVKIHIPLQLPAEQDNARIVMMMLTRADSLKHLTAAQDYIKAFPNTIEGYPIAASVEASAGKFADAENTMNQALNNVADKAAANYEFGKLIYNKLLYQPEPPYEKWTYDKALEYIKAAQATDKSSLYRNLEAQILFSQQKYAEADEILTSLITADDVNKAEIYYESARCKQAMGKSDEELVVLLDSAINNVDSISITSAAPYFLMRAQVYDNMKKYREAVFDYSRYQIIMNNRVNDSFFYTRFKAEVNARLYKQALVDIQNCIALVPNEPLYPAEKAQLELRVGMLEEAVQSASYCIQIAPDAYTGYTLLALAQARLDKKEEAKQNFLKAKELGETKADEYMEKYLK